MSIPLTTDMPNILEDVLKQSLKRKPLDLARKLTSTESEYNFGLYFSFLVNANCTFKAKKDKEAKETKEKTLFKATKAIHLLVAPPFSNGSFQSSVAVFQYVTDFGEESNEAYPHLWSYLGSKSSNLNWQPYIHKVFDDVHHSFVGKLMTSLPGNIDKNTAWESFNYSTRATTSILGEEVFFDAEKGKNKSSSLGDHYTITKLFQADLSEYAKK